MVEYLSIYSKDYLQFYHTHIPVSSFGTKKMQRKRVLTVYVYGSRRHQRVNILGGARRLSRYIYIYIVAFITYCTDVIARALGLHGIS